MQKAFLSLLLAAVSSVASADWASGGGQLVKDAQNPWFIQNTKTVQYCIKHDPSTFHQSIDVIDDKIQEAVGYWKAEFGRALTPSINGIKIEVATQEFIRTECSAQTDVVFQMGVLTDDQIRYMGDPTEFVALSVRTEYNRAELKGKGFVYVAPDSGPLKPALPNLVEDPWGIGKAGLLYRVLVHEIGHIFGLQHSTTLPIMGIRQGKGIMSSSYPETILDAQTAQAVLHWPTLPNYFANTDTPWPEHTSCSRDIDKMSRFFGIPSGWECYQVQYAHAKLRVLAQADGNAPFELIGTAELESPEQIFHFEQAVTAYLTEAAQRVFPGLTKQGHVWGPSIKYVRRKGVYKSVDATIERPIVVTMPLNEVLRSISGVLDDEVLINVESAG